MKIMITQIDKSIPVPEYAHRGDAGCDLYSRIDMTIEPGKYAMVPTGITIAIPKGYGGFVQPRSGLAAKHGISIVNSPGLIDSVYRGEVKVILINLDQTEPFCVKRGEKIAQLVIQKVYEAEFQVVAQLDDTERGEGGFGSTGI